MLVDSSGRTLYTFTNGSTPVACTGQCAEFWPPLVVSAGGTAKGAKGLKGIGVMMGTNQVTVKGLPVYRYQGDTARGQANGEGIDSFSGIWHVAKVGAATAKAKAPTVSSGSGSGY